MARLDVRENNKLASISGFTALTAVSQDIVITDNPQLTSLEGLRGVKKIGGNLVICHNTMLDETYLADFVGSIEKISGKVIADHEACASARFAQGEPF